MSASGLDLSTRRLDLLARREDLTARREGLDWLGPGSEPGKLIVSYVTIELVASSAGH